MASYEVYHQHCPERLKLFTVVHPSNPSHGITLFCGVSTHKQVGSLAVAALENITTRNIAGMCECIFIEDLC